MVSQIYKHPIYYEIAFSFINPKKQADLFEEFIRKFSKVRVKRVLDIGCGPSLQLRELAKRGYECLGLDLSKEMLAYLKRKAAEENLRIETIRADMKNFRLRKKVDFAFSMMGTIGYMKSNKEFLKHLECVAKCLKRGSLYLIENFFLDWKSLPQKEEWVMERNGIKVKAKYEAKLEDALKQLLKTTIELRVGGKKKAVLREVSLQKLIMPQELLALIELNGRFEFIGWFERKRNRVKPLTKAKNNNIVLLRKK